MAETDPTGSSKHVVVDVEAVAAGEEDDDDEAAATSSSSCGHHEVCVRCAALIRFVHNDHRCCICWTHCATVVVTRADRATATTHGGFPFLSPPPPPPAFGVQGHVYYRYHCGMGAYFDDLSHYQEMNKLCAAAASQNSEESGGGSAPARQADADSELDEPPLSRNETAALVLLGVAMAFMLGSPLLYLIPT